MTEGALAYPYMDESDDDFFLIFFWQNTGAHSHIQWHAYRILRPSCASDSSHTSCWYRLLQNLGKTLTLMRVVIGRLGPEHAMLLLSRGRGKFLITPSCERLGSGSIKVSSLKFHVALVGWQLEKFTEHQASACLRGISSGNAVLVVAMFDVFKLSNLSCDSRCSTRSILPQQPLYHSYIFVSTLFLNHAVSILLS